MEFYLDPIINVSTGNLELIEILSFNPMPNTLLFESYSENLDFWLFEQAVKFYHTKKNDYKNTKFTINLQLKTYVKFIDIIYSLISNEANLYIEIVEKSHDTDFSEFTNLLAGKLILDDFGTEASNVDRIVNLRPYAVKMDRVFFCLGVNFITAFRVFLENLDIKCIFEKVETEVEYAQLLTCGIKYMQGYYFDKKILGGDRRL